MTKVIKITESDLNRIVEKVINERTIDGVPEKQYKDDVDYVDITSSKKEKCSTCGWYENERCGMVKGIIDPNGWCNLWGTKKFCK